MLLVRFYNWISLWRQKVFNFSGIFSSDGNDQTFDCHIVPRNQIFQRIGFLDPKLDEIDLDSTFVRSRSGEEEMSEVGIGFGLSFRCFPLWSSIQYPLICLETKYCCCFLRFSLVFYYSSTFEFSVNLACFSNTFSTTNFKSSFWQCWQSSKCWKNISSKILAKWLR